jgi:hypothetical protein
MARISCFFWLRKRMFLLSFVEVLTLATKISNLLVFLFVGLLETEDIG